MKLSIFPKAAPHPRSKEEKQRESFNVSTPNLPTSVPVSNDEDLIKYVTSYAWSPFQFNGVRHADNFVSCDFLVYDIDEGLTIQEAEKKIEELGLCCLCLPSPSHTDEAHRFRLIFPLARSITDTEAYEATWTKGAGYFNVDTQCCDAARFYFGSTTTDGFWIEGDFFEPVQAPNAVQQAFSPSPHVMLEVGADIKELVSQIYGEERHKVPEAVDYFIRNAHTGLPGNWVNSLNRFCFSLALSEVPEDVIMSLCEQLAPLPLDKKDLYQIKRSISDGKAAL